MINAGFYVLFMIFIRHTLTEIQMLFIQKSWQISDNVLVWPYRTDLLGNSVNNKGTLP